MDIRAKDGLSVNKKQVWHEGNFDPDDKLDVEDFNEHKLDYATPHFYKDEGEDPEWAGVKYRLVMIDGEPFMEVVSV